ncbi:MULTISPECIES: class I SAM-dependent methyltransferase [Streptomyces]|uniref:class I SAM-dependent methyltransferase n=1 Tax=Streptomyces TaxID=1883 RepID=UPI0004CD3988|nr:MULTISPECIES: class I SAM-dependent methyltransferase [Streptomyces]KOT65486.1 methyltransferase [Streptomyces rimosus subsp. rimosus]
MGLSVATAARWVRRWERQQQRYAIDREERFTVIADAVEKVTAHQGRSLVVDLGCGPGSLAARLARRLPGADIVAVDKDPVLLALGQTHLGDAVRFVEAPVGAPGWTRALDLDRPLDAAVSSTALHCLAPDALRRAYQDLAGLLRPGGVLVNSDRFRGPAGDRAAEVAVQVGLRRAERQRTACREDWASWWAAAAADPELADPFTARRARHTPHHVHNGLPLSHHIRLLRRSGFRHAAPVWQFGEDAVLVAVR